MQAGHPKASFLGLQEFIIRFRTRSEAVPAPSPARAPQRAQRMPRASSGAAQRVQAQVKPQGLDRGLDWVGGFSGLDTVFGLVSVKMERRKREVCDIWKKSIR